jgi:hypothetical protein
LSLENGEAIIFYTNMSGYFQFLDGAWHFFPI